MTPKDLWMNYFKNINENMDIQIKAVCSVVRLLACSYFFKYRSAFLQSATADELLLESSGSTSYEKHRLKSSEFVEGKDLTTYNLRKTFTAITNSRNQTLFAG